MSPSPMGQSTDTLQSTGAGADISRGPRAEMTGEDTEFEVASPNEIPTARRYGARAEIASLEAELSRARDAGGDKEGVLLWRLASALAKRGRALDRAVQLGRRAAMLVDQPGIQEELSHWLAQLGRYALAGGILCSVVEPRREKTLDTGLRSALWLARAGRIRAAADVLSATADAVPGEPAPLELLGALGLAAPNALLEGEASGAFVAAAERREMRGERTAAFEDLLRAFELQPSNHHAARGLVEALVWRGRLGAADEIARREATEGIDSTARHATRVHEALTRGDSASALGAALDAHLDRVVNWDGLDRALSGQPRFGETMSLDEVLAHLGMEAWLLARLEVFCSLDDEPRAAWQLAQYLNEHDPIRARWLLARAIAHPGSDAAFLRRALSWTEDDPALLIDALCLLEGSVEEEGRAERVLSIVEQILRLGQAGLVEPELLLWAAGRLDSVPESWHGTLERAARAIVERADWVSLAVDDAERGNAVERGLRLVVLAPEREDRLGQSLLLLLQKDPENARLIACLERLYGRRGRLQDLAALLGGSGPAFDACLVGVRQCRLRCLARDDRAQMLALLSANQGASSELMQVQLLEAVWCVILGDDATRLAAYEQASNVLPPTLRATLLAIVAGGLAGRSDPRARFLAEIALNLDPNSARAATVVSEVVTGENAVDDAPLLERAVQVVVARADVCARLAAIYGKLGQSVLALVWAQRWLALRAGDRDAVVRLAECVAATSSTERIGEALSQILSQPLAVDQLSEPVAQVLDRLMKLDSKRAVALGWQVLASLGPSDEGIRTTLLGLAECAQAPSLAIAVLERWVASASGYTVETLMELTRRRRLAGDAEGAASALGEALQLGASPHAVLAELDAQAPPRTSDGALGQTVVRARCLEQLREFAMAAACWREAGAQFWDLAGDSEQALGAWLAAARLDKDRGWTRLSTDLVSFAGVEQALAALERLAESEGEQTLRSRIWATYASIAFEDGKRELAFDAALRALTLDPKESESLALAERCASSPELCQRLDGAYRALAAAAFGRFGERAVGYRAARFFEERGECALGLLNAARALEAVPSMGVVLDIFERLSASAEQNESSRAHLVKIANCEQDSSERQRWLLRAARLPPRSAESIGILIDAFELGPESAIIGELDGILADVPDDLRVEARERLRSASDSFLSRLEGPVGARLAIKFAGLTLRRLRDPSLAWKACQRALQIDASVDEFAQIQDEISLLMSEPEAAHEFVRVLTSDPDLNVGIEALKFGQLAASSLGSPTRLAVLAMQRVRLEPESSALREAAFLAAVSSGNSELQSELRSLVGRSGWAELALKVSEDSEARGEVELARALLQQLIDEGDDKMRRRARDAMRLSYQNRAVGSEAAAKDLETLLREWLEDSRLDSPQRSEFISELAALVRHNGNIAGAIAVFREQLERWPVEVSLGEDALDLARLAGDPDAERWALEWLVVRSERARRPELLALLAEHHESRGNFDASDDLWRQRLQALPADGMALSALGRAAERCGDWSRVSELLELRLAGIEGDEKRSVLLHQAAVLEQRLGKSDEARQKLRILLAEQGDHLAVLQTLADIEERSGHLEAAADLWERASLLAPQANEAASLRARAARNFLDSRRPQQAAEVLDHPTAQHLPSAIRHELRVAIARSLGDGLALAEALEPLADASTGTPEERAALLLEAAYATLESGRPDDALRLGQRSAALVPSEAEPQLLARWLEYLQRGPGSMDQAATMVSQLRAIRGRLPPEQIEMRCFLLAEALDVVAGRGAGLRELSHAHSECGSLPLIAIGLAERLADGTEPGRSLEQFDNALAGDLRGVRSRGEVALRAAEVCLLLEEMSRGREYLEHARSEPETRAAAKRLEAKFSDQELGHRALTEPAISLPKRHGQDEQVEVQSHSTFDVSSSADATGSVVSDNRGGRISGRPTWGTEPELGAMMASNSGSDSATATLLCESEQEPHVAELGPADVSPIPEILLSDQTVRAQVPRNVLELARREIMGSEGGGPDVELPEDLEPPSTQKAARARLSAMLQGTTPEEDRLLDSLQAGDFSAGERLVSLLETVSDRTRDRVNVCRMLLMLRPTHVPTLERLVGAALADRNPVYAAAVQHVANTFSPGGVPSAPPPIAEQQPQPEVVQSLIAKDAAAVSEVLALVVEGCEQAYRQELSSYGVTGIERIGTMGTPVSVVFGTVARWLGQSRLAAYQRRGPTAFSIALALVSPPAIVVSGEPPDDEEQLGWSLAYYVAAAMPPHALAIGMAVDELSRLLAALALAFGPPTANNERVEGIAPLAEILWQMLLPRAQRRLRELCEDESALNCGLAIKSARRACRRAGLLYSGNFMDSLQRCAQDEAMPLPREGQNSAAAILYCERSAAAQDLLRLATSPEYAEIRWQHRSLSIPPGPAWGGVSRREGG